MNILKELEILELNSIKLYSNINFLYNQLYIFITIKSKLS